MSLTVSVGMKNYLLVTDDLAAGMNGGYIKMYGSPISQVAADALVPTNASAALGSATLMCTISVDGLGTGLTMDSTPSNGVIVKDTGELWLGEIVATGYYSFYRWVQSGDAETNNTTDRRLQGTIGLIGADLIVSSMFKTIGDEQRVDSYNIGIP